MTDLEKLTRLAGRAIQHPQGSKELEELRIQLEKCQNKSTCDGSVSADTWGRAKVVVHSIRQFQDASKQWQVVHRGETYFYDSLEDCESSGDHLKSCDNDGCCNLCGEQ